MPYDPDFANTVEDIRVLRDSHRNAFRELAEQGAFIHV
jgi:hypothetical protein